MSPLESLLAEDAANAAAQRQRNAVKSIYGRQEGVASDVLSKAAPKVGSAVLSALMFPGRYARGETGYVPGQMAEEQPQATNWAAETATNMVGAPALTGGVPGMGSGIRAYHGSPHDFDRFDLKKIGTGEGAQAYGHGLYFAENPATAVDYKKKLSGVYGRGVDNDLIRSASGDLPLSGEHFPVLRHFAADDALSASDAAKRVQWRFPELRDPNGAGTGQIHRGLMAAIEQTRTAGKGRMYEVNINAKPEQFLDWDKVLPDSARETFANLVPRRADYFRNPMASPSGQSAYEELASGLQRNIPKATDALRDAGMPGIKYLDQGSRAAGDGSRNYVVFDDKLIDILRKYGLAGASPLAALMAQGTDTKQ